MALDPNTLYAELGTHYRHCLDFRKAIVGGWFAAIAALTYSFPWTYTNAQHLDFIVPLVAIVLTTAFLLADRRNRVGHRECHYALCAIEVANGVPTDCRGYERVQKNFSAFD